MRTPRKLEAMWERLFTPEEPSYAERVKLRYAYEKAKLPASLQDLADMAEQFDWLLADPSEHHVCSLPKSAELRGASTAAWRCACGQAWVYDYLGGWKPHA